jgi:hypothetical protein
MQKTDGGGGLGGGDCHVVGFVAGDADTTMDEQGPGDAQPQ